MIIDSHAIQTSSSHSKTTANYQSTTVSGGTGSTGVPAGLGGSVFNSRGGLGDILILSEEGMQSLAFSREQEGSFSFSSSQSGSVSVAGTMQAGEIGELATSEEEMKLRLLEMFLGRISGGVKFSFKGVNEEMMMRAREERIRGFQGLGRRGGSTIRDIAGARGGFNISTTSMQYESERVSYSAQGVVKTADGRTINLDLQMNMSREFAEYSQTNLSWRPPETVRDPLVINYAGNAASLTQQKYEFDIDSDGDLDEISFAGPGSGFLALDEDGNGKIDDGSELFGPESGNGFGELRDYDKDGNGWIDEADAVYKDLRIWSKDENGNDQLYTLQELGVGAIYLGETETEFTMKGAGNETQGIMRSTSFFLKEDGSGAGTVSHIDLRV